MFWWFLFDFVGVFGLILLVDLLGCVCGWVFGDFLA